MDLEDALKKASEIVEQADLPADLRPTAFQKAFDSLMGSASPAASPYAGIPAKQDAGSVASGGLEATAQKLSLPLEVVAEVFDISDGTLDVVVGFSRLADGDAAGTKQLAVLVAAGRQAAGIDSDGWTSAAEIREICKDFGKFDQANFGSTLKGMDKWFSISGSGRDRKVKMTRAGWEHAADLVRALTGEA